MRWMFIAVALVAVMVTAAVAQSRGGSAADPISAGDHCGAVVGSDPQLEPLRNLCRFAISYRQSLPNFVCRQRTLRKSDDAKHTDVVGATVTYENGRATYSDVDFNGKPATHSLRAMDGLTSWGEFGSILVMLFEPGSGAEFEFLRSDVLRGVPVDVFRFHVAQGRNSSWSVRDGHDERLPEYRGELSLSRATGRLMQEDIDALGLDAGFKLQHLHTSTEFEQVPVTGAGSSLLPMRSSTTACLRPSKPKGAMTCMQNRLQLSGCRRFGSESRVLSFAPADQ